MTYRYYVAYLAYVVGAEDSFIVPCRSYYETKEPLETEVQIDLLHDHLKKNGIGAYNLSPKIITVTNWKRID